MDRRGRRIMKRKSASNPRRPVGPKKKLKRSRKFWQQRKTFVMTPMPQGSDDEAKKSDSEASEEEVEESNPYEKLCSVFGKAKEIHYQSSEDDEEENSAEEIEKEEELNESNDDEEGEVVESRNEEEEEDDESEIDETEGSLDEKMQDSDSDEENNVIKDSVGSPKDPFLARYELVIPTALKETVLTKKYKILETLALKELGRVVVSTPDWKPLDEDKMGTSAVVLDPEEEAENPELRASQNNLVTQKLEFPKKLSQCCVKAQILNHIDENQLSPLQYDFFNLLNSYKDVVYTERTLDNGEEIRQMYVLHALNHLLKTRTKILLNNAKIAKREAKKKDSHHNDLRDQGLCRPKVLIVVPFKESARRIVDFIITLLFSEPKGKVQNRTKFDEEYIVPECKRGKKPDDFYDLFSGNIDDAFKIGLAVTKKSLKLYTDFYSSDIILASPLGLRMVLGSEGDKHRDYDFLTSIEMLIMDQVDVFAMQNWEHVSNLMSLLHLQPARNHNVDFSRIRMWTLDKLSPFYRQTIMLSSTAMPEINGILSKSCMNFAGKIKIDNPIMSGTIAQVVTKVPMVFHRFDSSNAKEAIENRFDYFCNKIMPEYKKDMMFHTLVFVPSYFDYVKVRNWFSKSDLDYLGMCEYTKDKKIAKARDLFFHSEIHFVLYTERLHFYRRLTVKGVRHIIFYQLPQTPAFFSELTNFLQIANQNPKGGSNGNMSCSVIYSKYDVLRLAPVVGSERARHMMQAEKNVHMFVAGS